jgi:hypothetical protein
MNKLILSLLATLTSTLFFAQTFTQSNEPAIGDATLFFLCDSNATNYAGVVGSGAVWNYSTLASYSGETKQVELLDATTTLFASDYPMSTGALKIEDFTYNFGNSTATTRISDGYVLEGTDIGDIKAIFSSNDQILMNYPSVLGASVVDSFAGNINFTYSGIPQSPACTGISYASYDGLGTLIQADGTSLNNISRFHVVDTLFTVIPVIGAAQIIRSQYEYYNLSSAYHLPVFMHISAKLVSGFPDPLLDVTVVLSEVMGSPSASLNENENKPYVMYPNPAKEKINIQQLDSKAVVSLIDLQGRKLTLTNDGETVTLPNWTSGVYFLEIKTENTVHTQSITIQ